MANSVCSLKKNKFILITAENKLCDKFMIFTHFVYQDDLHFIFSKTNEQTTSGVLCILFCRINRENILSLCSPQILFQAFNQKHTDFTESQTLRELDSAISQIILKMWQTDA